MSIDWILNPSQFGFRKEKLTDEAILAITQKICCSLNRNKKSTVLFIDLKKHLIWLVMTYYWKTRNCRNKSECPQVRVQHVNISDKFSNPLTVKVYLKGGGLFNFNLSILSMTCCKWWNMCLWNHSFFLCLQTPLMPGKILTKTFKRVVNTLKCKWMSVKLNL